VRGDVEQGADAVVFRAREAGHHLQAERDARAAGLPLLLLLRGGWSADHPGDGCKQNLPQRIVGDVVNQSAQ